MFCNKCVRRMIMYSSYLQLISFVQHIQIVGYATRSISKLHALHLTSLGTLTCAKVASCKQLNKL